MIAKRKRLLLIGGGHTHVEVVRRWALPDVDVTLVSAAPDAAYSGMLSGLIAGHYRYEQAHIDLTALCRKMNVNFVSASVTGVNPNAKQAFCDDGVTRKFDLASINIGSTPSMSDVLGARDYAVRVKPVPLFLSRWQDFLKESIALNDPARVVVVGGGPGGVELVLAMQHLFATNPATLSSGVTFTLVADALLPKQPASVQQRALRLLRDRNIVLALGRAVGMTATTVQTDAGQDIAANFTVFATAASAPQWFAESGLALDPQGFVAVNEQLQSLSHPHIYAAGDAATLLADPAPKSGVYAVRAGPILHSNLVDDLCNRQLSATFKPQRRAMYIISCGDKRGILCYGKIALYGRLMWRIKDAIDRRFMSRYAA